MVGLGAALLTGGHSLPPPGFRFENTLLHIEAADFLHNPADFQREAFGTAALLVSATDENELADVVLALEGTLAASIYSAIDPGDERIYGRLAPPLRVRCGRLLNDKMPTGLAVVPAMVHGGPYPASGHPGFTSVGMPASLTRFAALRAYDNVRPDRLPVDLRDEPPPSRPWRLIDGALTREAVGSR